jgi:hypothetical protein
MGSSTKTSRPEMIVLDLTVEVRTDFGIYSPVPLLLEITRMTSAGHKHVSKDAGRVLTGSCTREDGNRRSW